MFFCCGESQEKSRHVVEVFHTAENRQQANPERERKLNAYLPADRPIINSTVIHSGKNGNLNDIMGYFQAHHKQIQELVLKRIMKSDYEKLVDQYKGTNRMWTDEDFQPKQASFGTGKTAKVDWKRIGQIVKNPRFMGSSISPSDILQGRIGDCYFLSAIAGLAEKPQRIKQIFPNFELNRNGIYMARILHKGVLQEVVVDDYFPVSHKDGKLMGAKPSGPNRNQVWVMILEKCWAKLYRSYVAIDGGLPNEVLHAFSGAPIFEYRLHDESEKQLDEIFNRMQQSSDLGHVVCCGTIEDPIIQKMGLVLGHAYTILKIFTKPYKLVKIRNPWGQIEWSGTASDRDKDFWRKISNTDKHRLGYSSGNDGVFFMLWEDFIQYFDIIDICKINDQANYYYEELDYPRGQLFYSQLTTKGGSATLAITQENTRGVNVTFPRYATTIILLARKVIRRNEEDYEFVKYFKSINACDANMQLEDLPKGEYIICSMMEGRNEVEDATMSCYCEKQVQITPLPDFQTVDFLHLLFLDHARQNKQEHQYIYGPKDIWVCMYFFQEMHLGYTVLHVGTEARFKVGITFSEEDYEDECFQLLPPNRGVGKFKIVCGIGQDCIVVCRFVPQGYKMEASMPLPKIDRVF